MSLISSQLSGKRLELFKATLPGLSRVAVFWNPTNPTYGPVMEELDAGARALGLRLQRLVTAAVHGQGLVFAPLPFVLPLFRARTLVPVLPEWISQPAHLFVHYPNRRQLPVRVRSFVNFLLEHLRKNPNLGSDAQSLIAPFLTTARRKLQTGS